MPGDVPAGPTASTRRRRCASDTEANIWFSIVAVIAEIAGSSESVTHAGTGRDVGEVVRFDCPDKAKAIQTWLEMANIANWPVPPLELAGGE